MLHENQTLWLVSLYHAVCVCVRFFSNRPVCSVLFLHTSHTRAANCHHWVEFVVTRGCCYSETSRTRRAFLNKSAPGSLVSSHPAEQDWADLQARVKPLYPELQDAVKLGSRKPRPVKLRPVQLRGIKPRRVKLRLVMLWSWMCSMKCKATNYKITTCKACKVKVYKSKTCKTGACKAKT